MRFPQDIIPLNGIHDTAKLKRFVEAIKNGETNFPAILVWNDELLTGTHRWCANEDVERRGRTPNRIRVAELQLLPEDIRHRINRAMGFENFPRLQDLFNEWWNKQDETTQNTVTSTERDIADILPYECDNCEQRWRDHKNSALCCGIKADVFPCPSCTTPWLTPEDANACCSLEVF